MPALNRVQLIGYLGKEPESKYTPTGKLVTDFSMAVSQRWKSEASESKEHTEWVHVETWERLAEICQEYLGKGSLVYVEGRLKTDRYLDKGEIKYFTKVVAQTVQFLPDYRTSEPIADHPEPDLEEEDFESVFPS
jgi:single-strand DNA-binding protein